MMRKYFCSLIKYVIPTPPIKPGLLGKFIGHAAELREVCKLNKVNFQAAIYLKREEWYKITESKVLQINIFGKRLIMTSDPNFNREVLGQMQDSFTNVMEFKTTFGYFFPTSVIVVEGEQWERIRKILQTSINKQSLDPLIGIMCDTMEKLFSHQDVNQMNTTDLCSRLTFDSFHRVMYGWDPESVLYTKESNELLEACNTIGHSIGNRAMIPLEFLWKLPTSENRKADKARNIVRNFASSFAEKRRELIRNKQVDLENKNLSLIDLLIIASEKGEEGGLTNDELIDQICTLIFGAYDTTTTTLKMILNYLARYPEKQSKLRNEILKKFQNGVSDIRNASIDDIESISYNNYFVDEVNRLHGLAPWTSKYCIKDVNIQGYKVKKGTTVIIDSNTVGRQPKHWGGQKDLEEFRPERWGEYKPKNTENAMPFGFGRRICPGKKTALSEMKIFLAVVLSQYNITLRDPNEKFEVDISIGLHLKKGSGNINFSKL
jgi:cytochrome P450